MSGPSIMGDIGSAAKFSKHHLVVTGETFDASVLAREGIAFYDHSASAGAVTAILPDLDEETQCLLFVRNRTASNLVLNDGSSGSLEATIATGEGAILVYIGDRWAATTILKAATLASS